MGTASAGKPRGSVLGDKIMYMATNYTSDGTYWTGRDRPNGYLEVLRLKASNYEQVESWGAYTKRGSAVAAAAELAYHQGRRDALDELRGRVHEALDSVGLGQPTIAQPDVRPEDTGALGSGGDSEP